MIINIQEISQIVADVSHLGLQQIKPETSFEELKFDASKFATILVRLEDCFNVPIKLQDIMTLKTVQDLFLHVQKIKKVS